MATLKILLFNVRYSENLGDGLLAETLERDIVVVARSSGLDVSTQTLDLAGRTGYDSSVEPRLGARQRELALRFLALCPGVVRRSIVSATMKRRLARLRPTWDAHVAACDVIVIGGGNLLQDDDLNFPTKLAEVARLALLHGKPVAIHAVGVSDRWSAQARKVLAPFERVPLIHCSVRDENSQRNWCRNLPALPQPQIVADPALNAGAGRVYPVQPPRRDGRHRIGICVTSPVILRRHRSHPGSAIALVSPGQYAELITELVAGGFAVTLFTNGALEDEAVVRQLLARRDLSELVGAGELTAASRPREPDQLLAIISSQAGIVAHRLHACIAATALEVPVLGVGWDDKVPAFFGSLGREADCADGGWSAGDMVAAMNTLVRRNSSGPSSNASPTGGIDPVIELVDRLSTCANADGARRTAVSAAMADQ